jgi:2-iminoacetate synthase ThiH
MSAIRYTKVDRVLSDSILTVSTQLAAFMDKTTTNFAALTAALAQNAAADSTLSTSLQDVVDQANENAVGDEALAEQLAASIAALGVLKAEYDAQFEESVG